MKPLLRPFLLLIFYSCENSTKQNVQAALPAGDHLLNVYGKVGFDTSSFKKLACGLYINSSGILAYKATDNSRKFDSTRPLDVYLTTVYNQDSDSSGDNMRELGLVVDTATFTMLPNGRFEDRNHFYQFSPMSDGGTIAISKKNK